MSTRPWHLLDQSIHHLWSDCSVVDAAAQRLRRSGDGDRPLCPECALRLHVSNDVERELRRVLRLGASTTPSRHREPR